MKRFLMLMTTLLMSAITANAQSLSTTSLQALRELTSLEEAAKQANAVDCPTTDAPSWHIQAAQQGVAAWQRLRALCATNGKASSCREATCGTSVQAKPAVCNEAAGGVFGITLTGKAISAAAPCCGLKDLLPLSCPFGFSVSKTDAPCCCAKACACCESCKAKPAVRAQAFPIAPPVTWTMPIPPQRIWSGPTPQGWALPVSPPPSARVVLAMPASAQPTKAAHLVTPDLEAYCERIVHRGDTIVLEGNVLLLCKKHAQPIRIEAQRVFVNMNDGSFTVESNARPMTPTSFGVMRTSGMSSPPIVVPLLPSHEAVPAPRRIIQVVPVPQVVVPR